MAMPLLSRCGGCGAFARGDGMVGCLDASLPGCHRVAFPLRACVSVSACSCLLGGEGDRIYPMSIVESGTLAGVGGDTGSFSW